MKTSMFIIPEKTWCSLSGSIYTATWISEACSVQMPLRVEDFNFQIWDKISTSMSAKWQCSFSTEEPAMKKRGRGIYQLIRLMTWRLEVRIMSPPNQSFKIFKGHNENLLQGGGEHLPKSISLSTSFKTSSTLPKITKTCCRYVDSFFPNANSILLDNKKLTWRKLRGKYVDKQASIGDSQVKLPP